MQETRETIDDPPPAWAGWSRRSRREPWRQLVTAPTHDDAWGKLLDALAAERQRGGDSVVLPAASDPNRSASAARQVQGATQ